MFIQPRVSAPDGQTVRLDDLIGLNFAIIAWGTDPSYGMDDTARAFWQRLGARLIRVMPTVQLKHSSPTNDGVITIGDAQGRIKDWFRPFKGVATKNLPVYLAWFRFFDETGWVRAPGEFLRDAISRPRVKASSPM